MTKEVESTIALFLKKGEKSKVNRSKYKLNYQIVLDYYSSNPNWSYNELFMYVIRFQTSYKVDPSIIGGMVVSIGDKYADMSIASKMKKYTELIKAAA